MNEATSPGLCPSCGSQGVEVFHRADGVPVNSTLQLTTVDEARSLAKGVMALGFCRVCGFIHNTAFEAGLLEYSARCEETQGFSPSFSQWQQNLARRMVEKYDLRDRLIVEIGCGKGEFLTALCEIGNNRGLGFDPAYVPERNTSPARDRIEFVREFYTAENAPDRGDFLVCKMTLEHIAPVSDFIAMVRRSLGDRRDVQVFFQVPDMGRILEERAFWDVYYEHCSYFAAPSLESLFRRSGFEVMEVGRDYGGQYLMLEARPGPPAGTDPGTAGFEPAGIAAAVDRFRQEVPGLIRSWKSRLGAWKAEGRRVAVWGSGSKGVAFLTTLGVTDEIDCVVDINPHRSGHFMAGSGQAIVTPEQIRPRPPDVVVIMNPVYREEIRSLLGDLGVEGVEVVTVTGE